MAALSQFGPNRGSNQFGAGSLSAGLSAGLSAAGGLGNFQAQPVGRSSFDPSRMAEQAIRRARSQGDLNSAFRIGAVATNLNQQQQQMTQEQQGWQKLNQMFGQMTGAPQKTLGAAQPTRQGWANQTFGGDTGSRAGNVQQAMQDPQKFAAIRAQYNKMAATSGMTMDEQGNIVPVQKPVATTTPNPANQSIGASMGF